ncbi:hypothetical protein ACELLULO517_05885 [Acidisoma cellulosilytica]|uniref:Uncharacterized protein n=1 Tax=Acidisoma cellulosilyticum TaxID=2802395 RepID=A0A963YZ49_9PROT|nr:hypothetical protein [Acidisoma cellulosilyticum]MCB8879756.1 hypothetical protein [Acidisoma cellulosilyticum]
MMIRDRVMTATRLRGMAFALVGGLALLAASGVVAPKPALAWWRGGVWYGGPGPGYYGPRPYYYPPPIVVAPPPVYYAAPPVIYAAPPPPPTVYYPPQTPAPVAAARACYTPTSTCPMEVPRAPGTTCYCSDSSGNRMYGRAQ